MSDNNRGYDLDNFDDSKREGKHFKADDTPYIENDNFDLDSLLGDESISEIDDTNNKPDYGDDFYSTSDSFEPDEEEEFNPVITRQSYSRGVATPKSDDSKKKNIAIIVLSVTLAVVIFVFALVIFLNANKDDDKKPTTASTTASATVEKTEPTAEKTEAPTNEPTQEPTDAPTQAPTDAPTQAPTEAPTQPPTDPTDEPIIETTVEEAAQIIS